MESSPSRYLQPREFDPNKYPTVNWEVYFLLPPTEAQYQLAHVGESRAVLMLASMYGGVALCFVAVFLRVASRRISKTRLQADDWTIFAALVCEESSISSFSRLPRATRTGLNLAS